LSTDPIDAYLDEHPALGRLRLNVRLARLTLDDHQMSASAYPSFVPSVISAPVAYGVPAFLLVPLTHGSKIRHRFD
jgi:hypothetical protein